MRTVLLILAIGCLALGAVVGFVGGGPAEDGSGRSLVDRAPAVIGDLLASARDSGGSQDESGNPGRESVGGGDGVGASGFYTYVEPSGSTRIVSSLAEVPVGLRDRARRLEPKSDRVTRTETPPIRRRPLVGLRTAPAGPAAAPASVQRSVVVYTAPWCGWCRKTLAWLDEQQVEYTNKDIEQNARFRDELVQKSGSSGIPYVEIGDQKIRGYSVDRMQRALGKL